MVFGFTGNNRIFPEYQVQLRPEVTGEIVELPVKEGDIVILESTSPVGTTDMMESVLKEEGVDTTKLYIAHCPERVLPGQIMRELVENDRIVGGINERSTEETAAFYKTFVRSVL